MEHFKIITEKKGKIIKNEELTFENTLGALTHLRSLAFDMANSGKHSTYPIGIENFNKRVEDGFNDDGTSWTAEDGTIIKIEKL